jgi:hypothetical protein
MPEANEAIREQKARLDEATKRTREEAQERLSKGKPTPTQEENDRAALGEHVVEHEDDGSGPDPHHTTRQVEAKKPTQAAGYQTRASTPPPRSTPPRSE